MKWHHLVEALLVAGLGLCAVTACRHFPGQGKPSPSGQLAAPGINTSQIYKHVMGLSIEAEKEYLHPGCCLPSRPAASEIVALGSAAVPALLDALKQRKGCFQDGIIDLLGQLGPAAKAAAPELKRLALNTAAPGRAAPGPAFLALEKIIPGDPGLIPLAKDIDAKRQLDPAHWLAAAGAPALPRLRKLIQTTMPLQLDLLQRYSDSGAPLSDIAPILKSCLQPRHVDRCKIEYEPWKWEALQRWAEQALEDRPAERTAILNEWVKDYAALNTGAKAYIVRHLLELNVDHMALFKQALGDDAQQAAADLLLKWPEQRSVRLKLLLESIESSQYLDFTCQLVNYGEEGLEQLHRLALTDNPEVSAYAAKTVATYDGGQSPRIIKILLDLVRPPHHNYAAWDTIVANTAHPAAFGEMLKQLIHSGQVLPDNELDYLLDLYVKHHYDKDAQMTNENLGAIGGCCSCHEMIAKFRCFTQASLKDPNPDIRVLAATRLNAMVAFHKRVCSNPNCPYKQ